MGVFESLEAREADDPDGLIAGVSARRLLTTARRCRRVTTRHGMSDEAAIAAAIWAELPAPPSPLCVSAALGRLRSEFEEAASSRSSSLSTSVTVKPLSSSF